MAQEEIKLIGSFQDKITPELKKLNKEINNIGRSFQKFNRHLRPISREFGRMAQSAERFNQSMRSQHNVMRMSARAMGEYQKQSRKVAGSMRLMEAQRAKMARASGVTRSEQRKGRRGGVLPTPAAPASPAASKKGGAAIGASAGQSFMKNVASTAIGVGIANAFMGGIRAVGNMFTAPFRKFGDAFQERIRDEMDDLKSAGGMFALDMDLTKDNGNQRLFKNFNEALQFQEQINADMAKSASNLPGTTSQFVATNRQLTDSIQMVMENDRDAFQEFAERQGADITMGGTTAAKNAMAKVGQNLTESLMLASQGQQGGLPMHIAVQQILNAQKGKFKAMPFTNKFRAAFQKNPLLKNFLMRAEDEINKFEAGSVGRLEAVADVFARATPEEQIMKMRGSLSGLMESVRSGLLDPQGGLFGLSRAVAEFDKEGNYVGQLLKKDMDTMGNTLYEITEEFVGVNKEKIEKGAKKTAEELRALGASLDETSGIVSMGGKEVGKTSQSITYLFEQLRNFGANYGAVLTQFVGLLPAVFDPFAKMTKSLMPLTEKSQEMFKVFRHVNKNLDEHVADMKKNGDNATKGVASNLNKQVLMRSGLFAVTDFLQGVGGIDKSDAKRIKDQLVSKASFGKDAVDSFDQTASAIFKEIFGKLLNSSLVSDIGQVLGTVIGGLIDTTFTVLEGLITGVVKEGPMKKFMEGFLKGFDSQFSGGFNEMMQRGSDILMQIIDQIGRFIITSVIPAAMQALVQLIIAGFKSGPIGTLISGGIIYGLVKLVISVNAGLRTMSAALTQAAVAAKSFAKGAVGGKNALRSGNTRAFDQGRAMQGGPMAFFKKNAKVMKSGAKLAGGLSAVMNTMEAVSDISEGKDAGQAIGKAVANTAGSVIGGALGSVAGPAGTMIGAMAGGALADTIFSAFFKPGQTQEEAAKKQLEAANKQVKNIKDATGVEVSTGVVRDMARSGSLKALLEGAGAGQAGTAYNEAVSSLKEISTGREKAEEDMRAFLQKAQQGGMSEKDIAGNAEFKALKEVLNNSLTEEKKAAEVANKLYDELPQAVRDVLGLGPDKKGPDPKEGGGRKGPQGRRRQGNQEGGTSWGQIFNNLFGPKPEEEGGGVRTPRNRRGGGVRTAQVGDNTGPGGRTAVPAPVVPTPTATTPTPAATPTPAPTPAAPAVSVEAVTAPLAEVKTSMEGVNTSMEALKVSSETGNTTLEAVKVTVEAMKAEFPPLIETAIQTGVEPLVMAMTEMGSVVATAASEVVAALSTDRQDLVKIDPGQLPLSVNVANAGAIGGGGAKPGYKGFFPMFAGNVYSAAGGMNLGSAIATEMKHKPAGSDLVIANSSETIIPANMMAGRASSGGSFSVGDIYVNVSGVDDPKAIANQVAEEILFAIEKSTYAEVFTS